MLLLIDSFRPGVRKESSLRDGDNIYGVGVWQVHLWLGDLEYGVCEQKVVYDFIVVHYGLKYCHEDTDDDRIVWWLHTWLVFIE